MSRRTTPLSLDRRDGTSQRARENPALDPASVRVDERGHADLLAFVQAFTARLVFPAAGAAPGTWAEFAARPDLPIPAIVAYLTHPGRARDDHAAWLARPHFVLLLVFLQLLARARDHANDLTRRHLEHYYREVLRLRPEAPVPDRVVVTFRLAARAAPHLLPAGTALLAGRDGAGKPRQYRSERDLLVTRARVAELRSVFIDRRRTRLGDLRDRLGLSRVEVFEHMLRLALGSPAPGDPIPLLDGAPVDHARVLALGPLLRFARQRLFLAHHELRALMTLRRRRRDAHAEWAAINQRLGDPAPADPQDFTANFNAAVGGPLDFAADGLPQVQSLDDLHTFALDDAVRAYIETRLAALGPTPAAVLDNFLAIMTIRRRIDADWAEIRRLLARAGRRQRGDHLTWEPPRSDPPDFLAALTAALGDGWPPPWPAGLADIDAYDAALRRLELHFSMSAERLLRLVEIAEATDQGVPAWPELERLLLEAHREQRRATGRAALAATRGQSAGVAGFDLTVAAALGEPAPQPWPNARALLARHLGPVQLDLLDRYRQQLADPGAPLLFTWSDLDRVLELAQRFLRGRPEPVPESSRWHNLYPLLDATRAAPDPTSPRWRPFGRRPAPQDPAAPPPPALGWALQSPLLALSQGARTLTLTLGLRPFDQPAFLRHLDLDQPDPAALRAALAAALRFTLPGPKAPLELELTRAELLGDYFALLGLPPGDARPALRLELRADPSLGPVAALPAPALRVTLRPRWDDEAEEWTTALPPFELLTLAALHLEIAVEGLRDLRVQLDDRPLDPGKPLELFGPRPLGGVRLHLAHPELTRAPLDELHLDLTWLGLPADLDLHYQHYGLAPHDDLQARLLLVDRARELLLLTAPLFHKKNQATLPASTLARPELPAAVHDADARVLYDRRPDAALPRDLRDAERRFVLELVRDFGHDLFPSLAAAKARELAIGLSLHKVSADQAASYAVEVPYTPQARLSVRYRTHLTLDPAAPDLQDRLLHIHPFGEAPLDPHDPRLLPRYDGAGELYLGLADVDLPQQLSLLFQLAEGTSDPDVGPARIEWSILDGDRWRPLGAGLRGDTTRGLVSSGIVELTLPEVAPSTLLPGRLTWLRAALEGAPRAVCDALAVRTQAVLCRFDDQGNAPDHYASPLPVGTITRLAAPDPRIASVEQPYTSFGGRPPERPERFHGRVAERLRHKDRALTPWDYERLVLHRFPQIYKAKCLRGADGQVDLVVIPDIRDLLPSDAFAPRAPADLLADIEADLRARAPALARVRVRNARYVAVRVHLALAFRPGLDERHASARLTDDLRRFLSPWAYDEGAEITIGGRIYASSVVDFVDRRDYVDYVADIALSWSDDGGRTFRRQSPAADDYHVAAQDPDQVLVAAREHEIAPVTELDFQQSLVTGVGFTRIETDFLVS